MAINIRYGFLELTVYYTTRTDPALTSTPCRYCGGRGFRENWVMEEMVDSETGRVFLPGGRVFDSVSERIQQAYGSGLPLCDSEACQERCDQEAEAILLPDAFSEIKAALSRR